jgi:hypothetical protein
MKRTTVILIVLAIAIAAYIAMAVIYKKKNLPIGGDPRTWSPANKRIGGDPKTWSPTVKLGSDPRTWSPTVYFNNRG